MRQYEKTSVARERFENRVLKYNSTEENLVDYLINGKRKSTTVAGHKFNYSHIISSYDMAVVECTDLSWVGLAGLCPIPHSLSAQYYDFIRED